MILETDLWSPNAHTRLYPREHAHTYTPTHVRHHSNSAPNQGWWHTTTIPVSRRPAWATYKHLSQRPVGTAEAARYHESDPQYYKNVPDLNQAKP